MVSNREMVKVWLKQNERTQIYLARHAKLNHAIVSNFMLGKPVSTQAILKIAEATKLPLAVTCTTCGSICKK